MAVLTVDVGGTPISLDCQRGGHAAPRRVGPKTIGDSGTEESSVRAELMIVPIVTAPISLAIAASLRTLFSIGNQVACSGDIFNTAGTITCSGTITDELRKTADTVILNLTLYEIGTTLAYEAPRELYLANLADDATGTERKAWTTIEGGFANLGSARLLNGVTLASCVGPGACTVSFTNPATPEKSFLSTEVLRAGFIGGTPAIRMLSSGGTADKFSTQNVMATLTLVRSGADIYTTETGYSSGNGGFAGGTIYMTGTESVVWGAMVGDRVRIKFFARAGLNAGYTDGNDGSNLDRQTLTYGYSGGGTYYSALTFGALAYLIDPTV